MKELCLFSLMLLLVLINGFCVNYNKREECCLLVSNPFISLPVRSQLIKDAISGTNSHIRVWEKPQEPH